MLNFFSRKKKNIIPEGSLLTVDLHSHLLPGLDDGVRTEGESLHLIRGLMEVGFKKLITTPHIYRGTHNNSSQTILPSLSALRSALQLHRIDVALEAAAEYYFDEFFIQQLEKKELLTFGANNVLFELPFGVRPVMLEEIIFRMNVLGYKPVLAHPERYIFFQDPRIRELEKLKHAGVLYQLNSMSLSGQYGNNARSTARELINQNMIEFAGSDIHRDMQLKPLSDGMNDKYFIKLLLSGNLKNGEL